MSGIFGDLFDFDKNGKLDSLEQAMEFSLLEQIMDDEKHGDSMDFENDDDYDLFDEE